MEFINISDTAFTNDVMVHMPQNEQQENLFTINTYVFSDNTGCSLQGTLTVTNRFQPGVARLHTDICSPRYDGCDQTTDTHPCSPTIVTTGVCFLFHPSISTHNEVPESTRGADSCESQLGSDTRLQFRGYLTVQSLHHLVCRLTELISSNKTCSNPQLRKMFFLAISRYFRCSAKFHGQAEPPLTGNTYGCCCCCCCSLR